MQYFVLDFGGKKDYYRIVRRVESAPVRYEIQSMEDPRYVADVHHDGISWKFVEQVVRTDPDSLTGEKIIEYLIRDDSSVRILLATTEIKPYIENDIEKAVLSNTYSRKVISTGKNLQLVYMSLDPEMELGTEIHPNDQFFRIESGSGVLQLDTVEAQIADGSAFIVEAGSRHNVVNTSNRVMKLYTIYSPPKHIEGLTE